MKNYQELFNELINNYNINSDDKAYTEFFQTFVSDTSQEIIKTLNELSNSYLDKENIQTEQFVSRNIIRWKILFNLFNLLIKCCTESIEIFLERNKDNLETLYLIPSSNFMLKLVYYQMKFYGYVKVDMQMVHMHDGDRSMKSLVSVYL